MADNRKISESDRLHEVASERFQKLINNNLKKELEENIRSLANQVFQEVIKEDIVAKIQNGQHLNNNYDDYKKGHRKDGVSTGKIFIPRNSLLTDLLEISHIRTIYHIFVVILILLLLNLMIYDFVATGNINIGLDLIIAGFGKIDLVAIIWLGMQTAALLPYFGLKTWAKYRSTFIGNTRKSMHIWDILSLSLLVVYQLALLILPISSVIQCKLPIASSIIVLSEMMRFMMKSHAFVRTLSPRVLESKNSSTVALPKLSWYIYFLFAPTMIYRDSYPRTNNIKWNAVISRVLEVVAVIFYINFLSERFLIHKWSNFGEPNEILEAKHMVLTLFGSMLPALLTFLCGFYVLLHSWQNAAAEILTFADRRFYMDWWNQSDYGSYYRTWNMVVHDWLHAYIYKDIIMLTGSKLIGALSVFIISATFHEILLTFAFRFFYPVMLIMFGFFGVLLIFITKHVSPGVGNVFLWLTLAIGNGILWTMYGIEYFARVNCPMTTENQILDMLLPRSWFCHHIVFTPDWKLHIPFISSS